jgi:hypothetical protein
MIKKCNITNKNDYDYKNNTYDTYDHKNKHIVKNKQIAKNKLFIIKNNNNNNNNNKIIIDEEGFTLITKQNRNVK